MEKVTYRDRLADLDRKIAVTTEARNRVGPSADLWIEHWRSERLDVIDLIKA